MSAMGRPEREYRSAQREGHPMSAMGRPEREYRSAQREGHPMSAMGHAQCLHAHGEAEARSAHPRTWTAAESAMPRFAQAQADSREGRQ
jgi:hypothetical protein